MKMSDVPIVFHRCFFLYLCFRGTTRVLIHEHCLVPSSGRMFVSRRKVCVPQNEVLDGNIAANGSSQYRQLI